MLDPLTAANLSIDEIYSMTDKMIEAHKIFYLNIIKIIYLNLNFHQIFTNNWIFTKIFFNYIF